ncbi:MAG: MmcQ/YjbR family DNA-binding protein [Alphaproteobacteria bacterium]|nr:MmcQ/YjbR family DNA-binding protein [Alphaproteobacteria bacterium]
MKQEIIKFITKTYNASPEYLWRRYPTYCIFRHHNNNKWFALIGTVPRSILKLSGDGNVDIINLKTNDTEFFRGVRGILPAYHMNKNHWITILLDGTLPAKNIQHLIKASYELTK